MAFDAGYLAAVAGEIRKEALGGRIEKLHSRSATR